MFAAQGATCFAQVSDLSDIPHLTIKYYDVSGTTVQEIRDQLDKQGPFDPDENRRGPANTTFNARWYIEWVGKSPCKITSARVDYEIIVTLPRLAAPDQISSDVATKWDAFMKPLVMHERGHALIAAEIAQLPNILKSATCKTANDVANHFLEELKERNLAYDAATNHGIAQGIVF